MTPPRKRQRQHDSEADKGDEPSLKERRKRRLMQKQGKAQTSVYLLEEAEISSDEDIEGDAGEENEIREIEEHELSQDSFINDSSQLGYTQDALDLVYANGGEDSVPLSTRNEENNELGSLHRTINNQADKNEQFATPTLNRRIKFRLGDCSPGGLHTDKSSSANSLKGLGNMHFIRSVLDHHKKGGECHEIEAEYNRIAAQTNCDSPNPTETRGSGPLCIHFDEADVYEALPPPRGDAARPERDSGLLGCNGAVGKIPDQTDTSMNRTEKKNCKQSLNPYLSSKQKAGGSEIVNSIGRELTVEQKAMIEAKRLEALRRRDARLAQIREEKKTPTPVQLK